MSSPRSPRGPCGRILGFGGGVQTVAQILREPDVYDYIVFADVGAEEASTYTYMDKYVKPYCKEVGLKFQVVKSWRGDARGALRIKGHTSDNGAAWCTDLFKIRPVNKFIRNVMHATREHPVILDLGFSIDEAERAASPDKVEHAYQNYPLVFDRVTREDCKKIITDHGWPLPVKSACDFCMYHKPSHFARMLKENPERYEEIMNMEEWSTDFPKHTLIPKSSLRTLMNNRKRTLFDEGRGIDGRVPVGLLRWPLMKKKKNRKALAKRKRGRPRARVALMLKKKTRKEITHLLEIRRRARKEEFAEVSARACGRILSFGGGVQTTALLLRNPEAYSHVVFADVGAEGASTYEHLDKWVKPYCKEHGIEFATVKHPEVTLEEDMHNRRVLPMITNRWCTSHFKITPIRKWIREELGATPERPVIMDVGFSIDEARRVASESNVRYIYKNYPLVFDHVSRARLASRSSRSTAGRGPPSRRAISACSAAPSTSSRWHTRIRSASRRSWRWRSARWRGSPSPSSTGSPLRKLRDAQPSTLDAFAPEGSLHGRLLRPLAGFLRPTCGRSACQARAKWGTRC